MRAIGERVAVIGETLGGEASHQVVVPKDVRESQGSTYAVPGSAARKRGRRDGAISGPVNLARGRGATAADRPTGGKQGIPRSPVVLMDIQEFMVVRATGVLSGQRCNRRQGNKT